MERFGFGVDPPLDYPEAQLRPAACSTSSAQSRSPVDSGRVDIGRVAIGQGACASRRCRWRWSPRRWPTTAMLMKPRLTSRIVDPDGRTVERIEPEEAERVMSEATAAQVTT